MKEKVNNLQEKKEIEDLLSKFIGVPSFLLHLKTENVLEEPDQRADPRCSGDSASPHPCLAGLSELQKLPGQVLLWRENGACVSWGPTLGPHLGRCKDGSWWGTPGGPVSRDPLVPTAAGA